MKQRHKRSTMILAMTAALCGGSTFASCITRLNTAAVEGSKNFLYDLFSEAALDFIASLDPATEE